MAAKDRVATKAYMDLSLKVVNDRLRLFVNDKKYECLYETYGRTGAQFKGCSYTPTDAYADAIKAETSVRVHDCSRVKSITSLCHDIERLNKEAYDILDINGTADPYCQIGGVTRFLSSWTDRLERNILKQKSDTYNANVRTHSSEVINNVHSKAIREFNEAYMSGSKDEQLASYKKINEELDEAFKSVDTYLLSLNPTAEEPDAYNEESDRIQLI